MWETLTSYAADLQAHPGWGGGPAGGGEWGGGPGWWPIFPIAFWALVIATVAYLLWRRSPARAARRHAEATLAERYARGEIGEEELRQRRAVLRGKA